MNKSICFLLPGWITKHIGGAEWQCYLLSEELLKRGWKVEVITNCIKKSNHIENNKYYNTKIKYYYFKNSPSRIISIFKLLFILPKCKSHFFYIRTDARIFQIAATIWAKVKKKKTIYALAGDDELTKKSFVALSKQYRKNTLTKPFYLIESAIADFLFGKFNYKVDQIIVQTNFQKRKLSELYSLKSVVIENSIKVSDTLDDYAKENIILWIGYLRPVKQPEKLFELSEKLILKDWKIVLIGNAGKYNEWIKKYSKKITYLGELNFEETENWIKKAKILVNTSITEGFSNTFIQAWYYKVYIVSLNANPDNLISDQGFGFFANHSDEKMKTHLQDIINNKFDFTQAIRLAQQYALKHFNLNENVTKFESILNEL